MPCAPCALLSGMPNLSGLGADLTAQQKFDANRFQYLVGLYAKLRDRVNALPPSILKATMSQALETVRVNLNQIEWLNVKSPGAATWFDNWFGYVPTSGSTRGADYLTSPLLFEAEYRQNETLLKDIEKKLSGPTGAPILSTPQEEQPELTTPVTPSGGGGGTVAYKAPDWSSYLPNPFKPNPVVDKKKFNYNLIIVGAVIAAGAYMLWPRKGK